MGYKSLRNSVVICLLAVFSFPLFAQVREPDWVRHPPEADEDYYIGIAGSDTGNSAEDKEIARTRALKALASQIAVSLRSESTLTITDDGENSSVFLEDSINQNVMQNLEAIETVQVWASPKKGYWYYLRLNKSIWEDIQQKRADELEQRITEMMSQTFRNTRAELSALERAFEEYQQAFPGQHIKMNLFGTKGSADTLLLIRAETLLNDLTIELDDSPELLENMESVQLTGRIKNRSGGMSGSFSFLLLDPSKRIIAEWTSQPQGNFSWKGKLNLEGLIGDNSFTVIMDTPFQNEALKRELQYLSPQFPFQSRVIPVIQLAMEINGERAEQFENIGLSYLDDLSPFPLTLGSSVPEMTLSIEYRDLPENAYGLFFSQGNLFVTISDGITRQQLWKSPLIKEGGLTEEQARDRLINALLDSLKGDQDLIDALNSLSF